MGTRNLVSVMKNKEYKVAQYGQWDGYPEGQGLTVLNFLRECDLEKFKVQVDKCMFIEDDNFIKDAYEELGIDISTGYITMEDSARFDDEYPQLSRNMGGKILDFIMNNDNVLLKNEIEFANDSLFCEWAYVVDLDKNTFEIYKGFNTKPLSEDERFYGPSDNNGYYPVKHVVSFNLDTLPTKDDFLGHFIEEE